MCHVYKALTLCVHASIDAHRCLQLCSLRELESCSLQAMCVGAVSCASLGELMDNLQRTMQPEAPTLLHAAVRSGSISMASLLLDLGNLG